MLEQDEWLAATTSALTLAVSGRAADGPRATRRRVSAATRWLRICQRLAQAGRLSAVSDVNVVTVSPRARGSWATGWLVASYAFLAAGTAALIFVRPVTDRLADLGVYWGAAQAVRTGTPLYAFHAANGDPFTYPPFAMVLFYPLAYLPQIVVGAIWTVATLVAFVVLARVLVARWPLVHPGRGPALVWACAIALLLSAPGQSNVRFGQVSVFIVLVALADAVGAVPERMRGVLVGAAAAVKLTPLLFIVFYLVTGRRRDAVRAGVSFAVCTAFAFLLLPQASISYWTSALFTTSRIGDLAALGNQSVNGVLLRSGLPAPARPLLWLLLVAVLVVVALWRGRQLDRRGLPVHATVLVGCATLAASPVSWTHHQFWTVLAAILLVSGLPGLGRAVGWVLLASMTVNVVDLLARLPIGDQALFLAANMRGIAAAALCVLGLGPVRGALRGRASPPAGPDQEFQEPPA